jgi:hypothetical protein
LIEIETEDLADGAAPMTEELDGEDGSGHNGNWRWRPGRCSGGGHEQRGSVEPCSDTMLGIDELYSLGPKATIYSYMYR